MWNGRQLESAQLDRVNGQGRLPVEEADYDDGLAMASRETALDQAQDSQIGESPILRLANHQSGAEIGESPIGESPTAAPTGARAGDVKHNVSTKRYVTLPKSAGLTKRFRDEEQNYIFEQLEGVAKGPDFDRYRGKWINRVRDFPAIVREAVGDVKLFKADPRNHARSAGAMVFRRCQQLARSAGKKFHLI